MLLAPAGDVAAAELALAAGADLIDATALDDGAAAAVRTRHSGARLWAGSPGAVDADELARAALAAVGDMAAGDEHMGNAAMTDPAAADSLPAVVAAAALGAWLGAPVIRTRHVRAARRAIDMTLSIAGRRLPARTTRGLA